VVKKALQEHQETAQLMDGVASTIQQAGEALVNVIRNGSKAFISGNGGSAADAQHFAAELTGRFERERCALPAIALTTDTSALTAIGNDYSFNCVFSRQLEALAVPGDVLMAISTSGHSQNVSTATVHAKANGIMTIGLLGRDGGALGTEVVVPLIVPSSRTARIQEMYILILHIWCEMLDAA